MPGFEQIYKCLMAQVEDITKLASRVADPKMDLLFHVNLSTAPVVMATNYGDLLSVSSYSHSSTIYLLQSDRKTR